MRNSGTFVRRRKPKPRAIQSQQVGASLDYLRGKAVPRMPRGAVGRWAPLPIVVDAVLVWAAHDAVGHNDRERTLTFDEFEYLAGDDEVVAHVTGFYLPVPHLARLGVLGRHDADGHLGGPA